MFDAERILQGVGLEPGTLRRGDLPVQTPIDGSEIARVATHSPEQVDAMIGRAHEAFLVWRRVPAPRRGELIRLFAEELRTHKRALGELVTLENGKILEEGLGEAQEAIDIADFAVGLSRQLYGHTIASERPSHRMMETWHPLGVVGVITAFNFPVAVWAWNFTLALVCGDPVVWKPSEKTPLCALACKRLLERALARYGEAPPGLLQVVIGAAAAGERLADDRRVPLVSATGSCRMGRAVGPRVAARLGQTLLELGGNNAMIVSPSADLELALRAIVFAAVGTAGQRCTTLRRLIVHEQVYDALVARIGRSYGQFRIGNPFEPGTLLGPLIDGRAFEAMQQALARARAERGRVSGGERVLAERLPNAFYVRPALVEMPEQTETVREETFAPILYALRYREFEEAIRLHNDVPQGLASSIFTNDLREAERFISAEGSDCGVVNVNIGPSGAEVGGAFGGQKDTGGGREAGSDAWKAYQRRATNTVNYAHDLPLAQGIRFDVGA
ncbi:MAG: aldehyde dehydrogenase family protein [Candidatus Lambdaproteobacteria bacterium]|nr:aldehyde dehydrogenase family protein [Candidatus Lambdaproteobacteria bacterium]